MPADYKSRAHRGKQKKSLPGYVWLLSGLAIGLFVAFIVYLDKQPENPTDFGTAVQKETTKLKQQARQQTDSQEKQKPTEEQAGTEEKKEPKFNFYTLLPDLEVIIPESETRPPKVKNKSSAQSSGEKKTNKQYILQLGSFQNLSDAEKLKASVALLGIETTVEHVRLKNQTWHRVRTRPYSSRKQLYRNQKQLQQNNINAIAMELK